MWVAAGGSASEPQGDVVVRLYDGAVGPTRLASAQARASIDGDQRLEFNVELAPAGPRNSGHVNVRGTLPLHPAPAPAQVPQNTPPASPSHCMSSSASDSTCRRAGKITAYMQNCVSLKDRLTFMGTQAVAGGGRKEAAAEAMDIRIEVKDNGMMLISTISPECRWQQGTADINLRSHPHCPYLQPFGSPHGCLLLAPLSGQVTWRRK